jgi:hypothetical protein
MYSKVPPLSKVAPPTEDKALNLIWAKEERDINNTPKNNKVFFIV